MSLRVLVVVWFVVVAGYVAARAAAWWVVALLNTTWDVGLYGTPSVHTSAAFVWSLFAGCTAAATVGTVAAWARGAAWATPGLLFLTAILLELVPDAVGGVTVGLALLVAVVPAVSRWLASDDEE